ncbi:MAG: hypothetical protein ABIZ04_03040 [Opitutus sp.]
MKSKTLPLFVAPALAILLLTPTLSFAASKSDALFPMPENVRHILDQRCVMCHGEVFNGKAEIREDLNLSNEAAIKETLSEAGRLKEVIEKNEMPKKAKLSFRLRKDPKMKERLETIKAEYDKNAEKEVLMAWMKDIVATKTPDKKEKKEKSE